MCDVTDKPTPTTDLLKRCAEIYEWRCTGVLSGEALRDYAKRKWPDRHDTLQMAEHETVTEALALLAKWGQSAQAAEPVAFLVCTEEGDPDMVFLSQHEAQQYLEDDERPTPLYDHPSPPEGMVGGWIALPGALPEPGVPEPPGIQALMCVISSLRDIAHFSDEEGGELMSALCALRDWAYAQTAAFQPPPTSAEGVGS